MPDASFDRFVDALDGVSDGLVLGDGTWAVSRELVRRGIPLTPLTGDWPSVQLDRRFDLVVVEPSAGADRAAVVHCAVTHLFPGGRLALSLAHDAPMADRFDLDVVDTATPDGVPIAVARRTVRRTIHDTVFEARSRIRRVEADELARRLAGGRPPTIVDTRTAIDRSRFGAIAGSIHVPRTVMEFHLDPANGYRHAAELSLDEPIVVVCNGGYSSSLAAASLLDIGFTDVGDLIGGVRAWRAAGHPVVEPDHSHLDL